MEKSEVQRKVQLATSEEVFRKMGRIFVPVASSARHVHLCHADVERLFGPGHQLTVFRMLSQPGQYACTEQVTIVGPKGQLAKVRVLGPERSATQVEIAMTDSFKLGIKAPVRMSGKTAGTPGCRLVGPAGEIELSEGVIIAARHLHLSEAQCALFGLRDGQPVRMSKRTGNAITLTDLLEEVPIDSARFLFNMHDAGSGIDFDLDQAVKTDNDNPVYYVQYAHARICSILKKMESEGVQFAGAEHIDATLLTEPSEMDLIRMLAAFPQEIVMAAEKYDPSRINRFVIDLASAFHRFYGNCRIQGADPAVQQARLALCIGVKNVIFNVLTMFKINVPEKM